MIIYMHFSFDHGLSGDSRENPAKIPRKTRARTWSTKTCSWAIPPLLRPQEFYGSSMNVDPTNDHIIHR